MPQNSAQQRSTRIYALWAREVLDSRGYPTVEAEVTLESGLSARAMVPSGASTGVHEAVELRDNDSTRYLGKGVLKAVANLKAPITEKLKGQNALEQEKIDQILIEADGTANKGNLGANAILAASVATAKAAALSQGQLFAEYIHNLYKGISPSAAKSPTLPMPMMNIINGGAHADNGLDIQEFMIAPHGFDSFAEALRAGAEVFHHLKKTLNSKSLTTAVGDEGGFAPELASNEEALSLIMQSIEKAGYRPGEQISLTLDVAASEFFKDGKYQLKDKKLGQCQSADLVNYYAELAEKYPIISIEDGCAEDDWTGWQELSQALGKKLQLVGDDLMVTQRARLQQCIDKNIANAILIKLNQVGTLTETLESMALAASAGYSSVTSHRSGETEDCSIASLAVGTACGQIKCGSASRSERIAKYNELLRLEEVMKLPFAGLKTLQAR